MQMTKASLERIFFAALLSILLSGCGSLFYYPDSSLYVDVKNLPTQPEEISFQGSEGEKLTGWYFHASEKPRGKILFFHGNAENMTAHFASLYWILQHNYDYFIFDYPGYGKSEGKPTQKSTTDSGQKALQWLMQRNPEVPLVIFGQSLGGNIALYTAAENKNIAQPCLVTVESTFQSYRKVAQRVLAKQWITWPVQWMPYLVVSDSYSAEDKIQKISPTPLLVIHGNADPIVSLENGRDIFAAAAEPKEFSLVEGGGHIQAFSGDHASEQRAKFISALEKNCSNLKTVSQ